MNLSLYIQQKIHNHCFTNNIPNEYKEIDVSDLSSYPNKQELKKALDEQVKNIFTNYPEHYDRPMTTITDIYHKLSIEPDINFINNYITTSLEKERLYPYDFISISLIHLLMWVIENDLYPDNFWLELIDNGNSNLYHLYACGLFRSSGLNQELYNDIIRTCPSNIVINTIIGCKALNLDDFKLAYKNLPENLKEKIKIDCSNTTNKNIVLN